MSKQMLELADRLSGSLGPFNFLSREERDLAVTALRQCSADSAKPLRRCGMCMTWNSKPCGEQCGWSPDDPVFTEPQSVAVPASVDEIERIIRIEFHAMPEAARHAAERVYNFLDARIFIRAKTLARQTTTSGLPHREGQAVECDGGLRSQADSSPQAAPSDIERAFRDACDEAGCAYDNEALLEAIHALKERCQAGSVPQAAIENLTNHQVQCDQDGVMIQVSRQALDEVLAYVALTRPQCGGDK